MVKILSNYEIELDEDTYKTLIKYCKENDMEIEDFIYNNLELIGEI